MADGEQVVPGMQSSNDAVAEDAAPPAAPESLVARVSSLPAVSSAVNKLSTMYETSKASSVLLKVRSGGARVTEVTTSAPTGR